MDPRNISIEVLIAFAIIVAILCCFLFITFLVKILKDSVQKDIDEVLKKKETDVVSKDR